MMRLLISGGGTGGHIYPALALARYALSVDKDTAVLFVGTERGMESKIVPQAGFRLETIPAMGFQRQLKQLIPVLAVFKAGLARARKIIREFKPDVVLGTGGYVSAPVVLAAVLARLPAVIHEQNALPGLANRLLAPLVSRVCLSFAETGRRLPFLSKTVVTGNPRASEVAAASREEGLKALGLHPDRRTILAYGGSRGALQINKVMVNYIRECGLPTRSQLLYITGDIYYEQVMDELGLIPEGVKVLPYLNNMPAALAAADLLITRSGATTLAEITALGIPALLIPSPNVVNNHQYYNARLLADRGAALLINEPDFNHLRLHREIERLWSEPERLARMARASKKMGIPDAAARLYDCLVAVQKKQARGGN